MEKFKVDISGNAVRLKFLNGNEIAFWLPRVGVYEVTEKDGEYKVKELKKTKPK